MSRLPQRWVLTPSRARYWCTNAMAMLPSPTAAATRLIGLSRTSPQANTPGRLDSSRKGSRRVRPAAGLEHVVAGQHVAVLVARHLLRQPAGVGIGADEDEQAAALVARHASAAGDRRCRWPRGGPGHARPAPRSAAGRRCWTCRRSARSDSATCSSRASRRAPAASPGARGWRSAAPPGPAELPAPMRNTSCPCVDAASLRAAP